VCVSFRFVWTNHQSCDARRRLTERSKLLITNFIVHHVVHPSSSSSMHADDATTTRALAIAGVVSIAAATHFWKRRATTPFKLAAASAWLTAGPAAVLWYAPSRERVEAKLSSRVAPGERDGIAASGNAALAAVLRESGRGK
jgi:hypothetical protein